MTRSTLNARFVATVNRPGRYGDGRGGYGLALNVKTMANGRIAKSWVQRIRFNGKATNIGIGRYPVVSLSEARKKALGNVRAIAQGRHPRESGIPTFAEALDAVIEIHRPNWSNDRIEKQWRSSLSMYAEPLMRKRVDQIHSGDVLAVLLKNEFWNVKRDTARRVRQRIGAVCQWAIAQNYRVDNPAGEAIGYALPKNGVKVKHQKALPHGDVGAAIHKVRASRAWKATKLAFEFLVLTATRSGDVRGAQWQEFDLDARTWTVPESRTKAGREHRVPLSDRAMALLRAAEGLSDGAGLVFPAVRGGALSDNTLSKLLRELGIRAVPHGFRTSFRTWCGDTEQNREAAEAALAHVVKSKVEAAYARSDLLDVRRDMMQAWADYIGADE